MSGPDFQKQILVAGVGNAWMQDDGFGSEAAQRLERRELPSGVTVMDFGSGGLDLAYEIMRGYHALVLIDVSRQASENPDYRLTPAEVIACPAALKDEASAASLMIAAGLALWENREATCRAACWRGRGGWWARCRSDARRTRPFDPSRASGSSRAWSRDDRLRAPRAQSRGRLLATHDTITGHGFISGPKPRA